MAELTGSPVLHTLRSYMLDLTLERDIYSENPQRKERPLVTASQNKSSGLRTRRSARRFGQFAYLHRADSVGIHPFRTPHRYEGYCDIHLGEQFDSGNAAWILWKRNTLSGMLKAGPCILDFGSCHLLSLLPTVRSLTGYYSSILVLYSAKLSS